LEDRRLLNLTPAGVGGERLTSVNGTVYFVAADYPRSSAALWKAGPSGVVLVTDAYAMNLTPAGNRLFFAAFDATNGMELWTDDSAGGHRNGRGEQGLRRLRQPRPG
jgi:hypothetical protein